MLVYVVEFGCVCIYFVFLDMKLVVEDNATLMKRWKASQVDPKERSIRMQERIRRWWKIVWVQRLFV
ncbi:unnamed protein product [Sphagnum troendelagicum]|uniref:Uncharacterized protein n=1 Tax=Sphagnum troendelagicum TaxID=128251 RepID=A0ABP0TDC7_9BRYO